jgi:hypothetical protein
MNHSATRRLDTDRSRDRERLEAELHDCDRRVQRYRALLDRGVDPDIVAGWLNEVAAARRVAEHRLAELQAQHTGSVDRDAIRTVLADIGGLAGLPASSNPGDRAQFYEAVGIAGTLRAWGVSSW